MSYKSIANPAISVDEAQELDRSNAQTFQSAHHNGKVGLGSKLLATLPTESQKQNLPNIPSAAEVARIPLAALPAPTGNAGKYIKIDSAGSLYEAASVVVEAPLKLPNTHSPVALYHFDGDLVDQGSAGEDLVVTGNEIYTVVPRTGERSFYLDGSTRLAGSANAATQIAGDYTLEMAIRLTEWASSVILYTQGGLGETQAENTLFGTRLSNGELSYLAEHSAGVNITYALSGYRVPLDEDFLFQEVRSSSQVSWYINGRQIGASSVGLAAPDGGGSGWFSIGDIFGGSAHPKGILHSLRIVSQALTPTQLQSSAEAIGLR